MGKSTVEVAPAPVVNDKAGLQALRAKVKAAADAIGEQSRLLNKINAEYRAAKVKKIELEEEYRAANRELLAFAKGAN